MEKQRKRRNRIGKMLIAILLLQNLSPLAMYVTIGSVKAVVTPTNESWGFNYTGSVQEFTAPKTGRYFLETYGAQGGGSNAGGYSSGYYGLTKGEKVYIYVGGQGEYSGYNYDNNKDNQASSTAKKTNGGWNGGGDGYKGSSAGGGATDIRLEKATGVDGWNNRQAGVGDDTLSSDSSLKSRIIVAGGAGGTASNGALGSRITTTNPNWMYYGLGGGYFGGRAEGSQIATQNSGYAFGKGQDSNPNLQDAEHITTGFGGAGGGGWYGGGNSLMGHDYWAYNGLFFRNGTGSGGSGYVDKCISTDNYPSNSLAGKNFGNGKAKVSYVDNESVEVKVISLNGTVNDRKGEFSLGSFAPGTEIVLNVSSDTDTSFNNFTTYSGDGQIIATNTIRVGFSNTIIQANYTGNLTLTATFNRELNARKGATSLKWVQNDETEKYFLAYKSTDLTNWENIAEDMDEVIKPISEKVTNGNGWAGAAQAGTFVIPTTGIYRIQLKGAGGAGLSSGMKGSNGKVGATTEFDIKLKKGDTLNYSLGSTGGPIMGNRDSKSGAAGKPGGGAGSPRWTDSEMSDGVMYGGGGGGRSTLSIQNKQTGISTSVANSGGGSGGRGSYNTDDTSGASGGGGADKGVSSLYINSYNDRSLANIKNTDATGGVSGGGSIFIQSLQLYSELKGDGVNSKTTDQAKPDVPFHFDIQSSQTTEKITWMEPKDNGTNWYHKAESYNLQTDALMQTSNITTTSITSGVKGYRYYVDSNSKGIVTSTHSEVTNTSLDIPSKRTVQYLHIAAEDRAGNLSDTVDVEISTNISLQGNIIFVDNTNEYKFLPSSVNLKLFCEEEPNLILQSKTVTGAGNVWSYEFTNVPKTDKGGTPYNYYVVEEPVDGYEISYEGLDVINTLVIPEYISSITYTPVESFENKYLKNAKVKVEAKVVAKSENRELVGMNGGMATFTLDNDILFDRNTLKITYQESSTGITHTINNYTMQNNTITVALGKDSDGISKKSDTLKIEITGTINAIKEFSSHIVASGKLTTFKGTNTNVNLGEVTKAIQTMKVDYQLPEANLQIQKKDSITENKLTDAEFTLYEWNGSQYIVKEVIKDINQDGIYESNFYRWNFTTQGKYKVVETKMPENHVDLNFSMEYSLNQLKTENYTINPDYNNGEYTIRYQVRNPDDFDNSNGIVENEPYKFNFEINNIDSQTKQVIQNKAEYTIYEWDKTIGQYKEYTSYVSGNKVGVIRRDDKIYTADQWLYYTKNNEGNYKIVEKTAAPGYYGDYDIAKQKREYTFNVLSLIKEGSILTGGIVTLSNVADKIHLESTRVQAQVNVQTIDAETKTNIPQADATLQGAVYGIYAAENIYHADGVSTRYTQPGLWYYQDELIKTASTDNQAKFTIDNLECGKYYIKQLAPAQGYVKEEEKHAIDLSYRDQSIEKIIVNQTYENKVKKQAFQIYKLQESRETEYTPLKDAEFSIYQISGLSIVKEGKIEKNEDGTYQLKDKIAQQEERITKKMNTNGSYHIEDLVEYYYKIVYTEETMQQLPQGEKVYYPYNVEKETFIVNYANTPVGEQITPLISDDRGYIKSPELAYGEYIAIETGTPKEFKPAKPFKIVVQNDVREMQNLRYIIDDNFTTKLKIYTKDIQTKQTILKGGAKFVIQNTKTQQLLTNTVINSAGEKIEVGSLEHPYQTNRNGFLITPIELGVGKYKLIQVEATNGYVKNGYEGYAQNHEEIKEPLPPVEFEISTNAIYYVDNYLESNIIVTTQENKQQVGTLKLTLTGEFLKEANKKENQDYAFEYEKKAVQGAQYGIYAKETINTQDNQGTVVYEKDQLVQNVTTDEQGIGYMDNLLIGEYYLKEITAAPGFALNKETKEISILYGTNEIALQVGTNEWKEQAQITPVVKKEQALEDKRQKIEVTLTNQDQETKEAIPDVKIGIYAKEDIKNEEGTVVVKKDELIQTKVTNEQGQLKFDVDLPLGTYYVKEIEAGIGYVENKQVYPIDGTYQEDQKEIIIVTIAHENRKTEVNIKKIDEQKQVLVGVKLELVGESGNKIEEWNSQQAPKNMRKLETNKKYTIKEQAPLEGYVTIDPITFIIRNNGEIETQEEKEGNTILVTNRTTKLEISLRDKDTKERIPEVKLEIIKVTQNEQKEKQEEKLREFTTQDESYLTQKLPIGEYVLREVKEQKEALLDKGYVTNKDITFTIKDVKEVQKLEVLQEVSKLQVSLLDKDTKEEIEGSTLQITKKVTKIKEETLEQEEKEEVVKEWKTTKESTYIEKLPVGEYTLVQKEVQLDKGFVTSTSVNFKVEDTIEVQKVEMLQAVTKLEISLIDKQTKEKVESSTLQLIKQTTTEDEKTGKVETKEEIVKEIITTKENSVVERLPQENYTIRQKEDNILIRGYIRIEDEVIKIEDSVETKKIELQQDYTKLEVTVVDKETKEPIIGATLVIQNEKGKEITTQWVSDGKPHLVERIPVDDYQLVEKVAPTLKGYVNTSSKKVSIQEKKEIQPVEMLQEFTQVEIQLIDKVNQEAINQATIIIKNEKGKEVGKIELKETNKEDATKEEPKIEQILKRLPIGKYIVEASNLPYGYKAVNTKIEVYNTEGLQTKILEVDREEFDIKVEEWVNEIVRNGQSEYKSTKAEVKAKKIDIKDKKINTEDIKVVYTIRITNVGKITGQIGKVVEKIPSGMLFKQEDNKEYWVQEGNTVVSTALKGKDFVQDAYTELSLVLRWKNGMENFGNKMNVVEIQEVKSNNGFKESNLDNNKARVEVIMGVGTGEISLIWICIGLLLVLVPLEIVITRRLRIKGFKLKDKSTKYNKK